MPAPVQDAHSRALWCGDVRVLPAVARHQRRSLPRGERLRPMSDERHLWGGLGSGRDPGVRQAYRRRAAVPLSNPGRQPVPPRRPKYAAATRHRLEVGPATSGVATKTLRQL